MENVVVVWLALCCLVAGIVFATIGIYRYIKYDKAAFVVVADAVLILGALICLFASFLVYIQV